mmetsp:Transcript_24593/g.61253  ORF Transcript_24593/g.61253 Transcript_24593/m.61253 type:complete len:224 (-) Transcript_24593:2694-3365(-)
MQRRVHGRRAVRGIGRGSGGGSGWNPVGKSQARRCGVCGAPSPAPVPRRRTARQRQRQQCSRFCTPPAVRIKVVRMRQPAPDRRRRRCCLGAAVPRDSCQSCRRACRRCSHDVPDAITTAQGGRASGHHTRPEGRHQPSCRPGERGRCPRQHARECASKRDVTRRCVYSFRQVTCSRGGVTGGGCSGSLEGKRPRRCHMRRATLAHRDAGPRCRSRHPSSGLQ